MAEKNNLYTPLSPDIFKGKDGEVKIPSREELWSFIVTNGKKIDNKRIINLFDQSDVRTILGTMEFFGASDGRMMQVHNDCIVPKFRLFDWLGMWIMYEQRELKKKEYSQDTDALKVLIYAFLDAEGLPNRFIENLRIHDYQVEREWEKIEI